MSVLLENVDILGKRQSKRDKFWVRVWLLFGDLLRFEILGEKGGVKVKRNRGKIKNLGIRKVKIIGLVVDDG